MYINNKILIGKNESKEIFILPKMANRHGIISGASGSGKTITLKVLAESFSEAGVPVFLVDVKGDLAGMCLEGMNSLNISKRIEDLKLENFNLKKFPTKFFDIYGKYGHPIRTTISNIGPKLLSRMLGLTNVQEGVLSIVFKICEDENLELIDLNDLRSVLTYIGNKRQEYTIKYGNISLQSIGSIQRNLLNLEEEGADKFFGKPDFNIKDLMKYYEFNGYGYINILHATELFRQTTLYSSSLLWLLNTLYETLPEVGDLEKPKLVLFIDEAHLLFSEIPDYLLKQIIQIVKLIRSKGVGLFFISQSPSDIPNEVLSQLSNRIQHTLRYYTKSDEKAIKCAAESFRDNPLFNTIDTIKELKIGEALISVPNEYGEPSIVEKVTILPPQSKMGTITDNERKEIIENSTIYKKYEDKIDDISAKEKIEKLMETSSEIKIEKKTNVSSSKKSKKSSAEKAATKVTNSALNTLGRKIGNSIFKGLFK